MEMQDAAPYRGTVLNAGLPFRFMIIDSIMASTSQVERPARDSRLNFLNISAMIRPASCIRCLSSGDLSRILLFLMAHDQLFAREQTMIDAVSTGLCFRGLCHIGFSILLHPVREACGGFYLFLDFLGHGGIIRKVFLRVFTPLTDPLFSVGEPGAGLFHAFEQDPKVEDIA